MRKGVGKIQCENKAFELLLASLGALCTVLGAGLHPVLYALGIQSAADDVVTHTGKVLNTTTTDEHYAMLLKIVTHAGNVS